MDTANARGLVDAPEFGYDRSSRFHAGQSSDNRYSVKRKLAILEIQSNSENRYNLAVTRNGVAMLTQALVDWLNTALAESGHSQAEVSRFLTKYLGRSVDYAAVQKMTIGKRKISADEMLGIELLTGVPAPRAVVDAMEAEFQTRIRSLSPVQKQMLQAWLQAVEGSRTQ